MKQFNVAVFVCKYENSTRRKSPYDVTAYLRDYSSEWPGYNKIKTFAKNGTEAKKRAIRIVKAQLAIQPSMVNVSSL
jgi:hypothetical protein